MADLVADEIRSEVLSGRVPRDTVLPRQELLLDTYGVSPPSLREALRILEAEGLATTIRGNVGGVQLHPPRPEKVAYLLAMVLQDRAVAYQDLMTSLGDLEALCAELAAARDDREEIVATLRNRLDHSRRVFDDTEQYVRSARGFHTDLVHASGSATLEVIVGVVETVFSSQIYEFLHGDVNQAAFADLAMREDCLAAHTAITDAIADGDGSRAAQLTRDHMREPNKQSLLPPDLIVQSNAVRNDVAARRDRPTPQ
ncbi:MAG: FCD domain-containing protein [Acidimicrobiales bacterium]